MFPAGAQNDHRSNRQWHHNLTANQVAAVVGLAKINEHGRVAGYFGLAFVNAFVLLVQVFSQEALQFGLAGIYLNGGIQLGRVYQVEHHAQMVWVGGGVAGRGEGKALAAFIGLPAFRDGEFVTARGILIFAEGQGAAGTDAAARGKAEERQKGQESEEGLFHFLIVPEGLIIAGMQGIDELIFSRRRRITLAVQPGGRVILRAPLGTSEAAIRSFLEANAVWLENARRKMARLPVPPAPYKYTEGEPLLYLGQELPLRFEATARRAAVLPGEAIVLLRGGKRESRERLKELYREETRRIVQGMVDVYAARYGLRVSALRVNSAERRWGSCSVKASLNFSLRLAMLPVEAIEYVVVHELAHLREHNHSRAFWTKLGEMLPDYARRREWLKRHGGSLPPF